MPALSSMAVAFPVASDLCGYHKSFEQIMKQCFLFTVMALCLSITASAQLRFGPELGLNINKLDYDFPADESSNMGLRIGALADIGLGRIYLQPGLYFSMKGGEADYVTDNVATEINTNLNYIEIPFLVQYKHPAGPGKFFIGLGPAASIALGGETKTTTVNLNNGVAFKDEEDIDFGDDIGELDRGDIGVMFNLGYELDRGLFFRLFYNKGLSNLSNFPGIELQTSTFGISAGYLF